MNLFSTACVLCIAMVPTVDMNQFPMELNQQEFTEQQSITGNSYEDFNSGIANPYQ